MDKKNFFLGMLCIIAGFGFYFYQAYQQEEQRREFLREQAIQRVQEENERRAAEAEGSLPAEALPAPRVGEDGAAPDLLDLLVRETDTAVVLPELDAVVEPSAPAAESLPDDGRENTFVLENDFIRAVFTSRGGALQTVSFKQTKRGGPDYFVFNENGIRPALSLSLERGNSLQELQIPFEVVSQSSDEIVFRFETPELRITRLFRIHLGEDAEPYLIRHETTFENTAQTAREIAPVHLNVGTSLPNLSDQRGTFLNVGYFNGDKSRFIAASKFTSSSGFLGIGARSAVPEVVETSRIEWTAVKNQFFASVLTGDQVGHVLRVQPVFVEDLPRELAGRPGVSGTVGYRIGTLQPGQQERLGFDFYVGPKEYLRLQRLGNDQDLVMQFGFLSFFSKILFLLMSAIHAIIPSWGWSIVIMTILLKLLFWPLTAKAAQSQKRMSKLQGPMKELREKFKDEPQKMQAETIKLFREAKVNPLAGCLPILIQMPIFIGLFYMLRTVSELRYEPFLWVGDLSSPDTLFVVGGFPVNLLPVLMGVSMFFQMKMMPTSPTADPLQQKLFRIMPLFLVIFLYNFAAGLTLYWTMQNLLTILQQWLTNRRQDPEMDAELAKVEKKANSLTKGTAKKRPNSRPSGKKK